MDISEKDSIKHLDKLKLKVKQEARCLSNFLLARDTMGALVDNFLKNSEIVNTALFHASVIHYCNPFSGNKTQDGGIYKYPEKWIKKEKDLNNNIHEQFKQLRNKVIGHSDHDFMYSRLTNQIFSIKNQNSEDELMILSSQCASSSVFLFPLMHETTIGMNDYLVKFFDIASEHFSDSLLEYFKKYDEKINSSGAHIKIDAVARENLLKELIKNEMTNTEKPELVMSEIRALYLNLKYKIWREGQGYKLEANQFFDKI